MFDFLCPSGEIGQRYNNTSATRMAPIPMAATIWSLGSATNVYRSVAGFILFHRPVEWAHETQTMLLLALLPYIIALCICSIDPYSYKKWYLTYNYDKKGMPIVQLSCILHSYHKQLDFRKDIRNSRSACA